MAVQDLWLSSKPDASGKRQPTRRHGRGQRYRVNYVDDMGKAQSKSFDKRRDADAFDVETRSAVARGQNVAPDARRITVADYSQEWLARRMAGRSTVDGIERILRLHVNPHIGHMPIAAVTSDEIETLIKLLHGQHSYNYVTQIRGYLRSMFGSAVRSRKRTDNPCEGIQRLPARPRVEMWIPTPAQVHDIAATIADHYRAAVYVAAGCGLRPSEVMGLELDHIHWTRREVYVRQQIHEPSGEAPHVGKLKSAASYRTGELSSVVLDALAQHVERYPPVPIDVTDMTDSRKPRTRTAMLLFPMIGAAPRYAITPMRRSQWSIVWRDALKPHDAIPAECTMHTLRHYFASLLIERGANVKTVQLALGHARASMTLDIYTHLWPDVKDRVRNLVDDALGTVKPGLRAVG